MSEFEWDDAKAKENLCKHGVSFELATQAFRDPCAVESIDEREDYGEERNVFFGVVDGTILVTIYTERGERTRLISARRATRHEQDFYHRKNGA